MKVTFMFEGILIQVEARVPEDPTLSEEETRKAIIKNAINDIKNKLYIDVTTKIEDVYSKALIA